MVNHIYAVQNALILQRNVYVDYILDNPEYCKEGYVVMSIKPCAVSKKMNHIPPAFNSYEVPLATTGREDNEPVC